MREGKYGFGRRRITLAKGHRAELDSTAAERRRRHLSDQERLGAREYFRTGQENAPHLF
jgi:hypothetical protein